MTTPKSDHVPEGAHHLVDEDGVPLGWTVIDHTGPSGRAEPVVRQPTVDAARLARVSRRDLAGMRVATSDEELAVALVESGGTLVRHASVMIAHPGPVPSDGDPGEPDGIVPLATLPPADESLAAQLAGARLLAYPPTHPDHDPTSATLQATGRELHDLLTGSALGPAHPELSAIVRTGDRDTPIGAIIVTMAPADAIWSGGPWIADLFVDPRHAGRGLGRRLLQHTLDGVARLGLPRIGLAVTDANPAADLYRSAGFETFYTSWAIMLPAHD